MDVDHHHTVNKSTDNGRLSLNLEYSAWGNRQDENNPTNILSNTSRVRNVKWDSKTDFYDILRHFGDHPALLMSESRSDQSNNVVR